MTTNDPTSPASPAPETSNVRRRWMRLIIGLIVVNVLVLAGILVLWYPRFDRVEIVDSDTHTAAATSLPDSDGTEGAAAEPSDADQQNGSGSSLPSEAPPLERLTFLVMGSDSRENLPQELGIHDQVAGQRADVIMIVAIEEGFVRVLSLPRDLRVEIEGAPHKLNAAYAIGGPNPQLLYDTVERETGINLDYYVELDFAGFAAIVDELGGVDITFPYPARDLKSFLDVEAGRRHLDGRTALAYARSRQYEEYRDGEWIAVEANDLGRISRQQSLLFSMLSAFKDLSLFDVNRMLGVLGALERHIRIDSRLSDIKMIELVAGARSLSRESIDVATLPVREVSENGVYYLVADPPGAEEVYQAFRDGAVRQVVDPVGGGPILLKVLNGNGGNGQATKWSEHLRQSGFTISQVDDAGVFNFPETVITVHPDDYDTGKMIVEALGFGRVEPGPVHEGLDAVVTIGADALGR